MQTFVRDKRSPIPKNGNVSKLMSSNSGKNTSLEIQFRKRLWKNGNRGYRLHNKKLPGKPDISFQKYKIAIFINGCFWHRCPYCNFPLPKFNYEFWKNKFDKNIERDKRNIKRLKEIGWSPITIWECQIKKNSEKYTNKIIEILKG